MKIILGLLFKIFKNSIKQLKCNIVIYYKQCQRRNPTFNKRPKIILIFYVFLWKGISLQNKDESEICQVLLRVRISSLALAKRDSKIIIFLSIHHSINVSFFRLLFDQKVYLHGTMVQWMMHCCKVNRPSSLLYFCSRWRMLWEADG